MRLFFTVAVCVVQNVTQMDFLRAKKTKSTKSLEKFVKSAKREVISFPYNANFGYEPYWADGEYVLTTTTQPPHVNTTKMPTICGDECNYLLRRVKHVCAHKSDYNEVHGCPAGWWVEGAWKCSGNPGDDLNPGFTTFNTYCELLDAQCRFPYTKQRYVLVHVGKCTQVEDYFKPIWDTEPPPIIKRLDFYLKQFSEYFSLTTVLSTKAKPTTTTKAP